MWHSVLSLIIAMLLFAAGVVVFTWPPVRGRILLGISLVLQAMITFSFVAISIGIPRFNPTGDFRHYVEILWQILYCSHCVAAVLLLVALAMMRSGLPRVSFPTMSGPYPMAPDLGTNWPAPPRPPDTGPPDIT